MAARQALGRFPEDESPADLVYELPIPPVVHSIEVTNLTVHGIVYELVNELRKATTITEVNIAAGIAFEAMQFLN